MLDSDDSISKLNSDSDDYEEEFEEDFGLQNPNKKLEVGDYIIVKLMPRKPAIMWPTLLKRMKMGIMKYGSLDSHPKYLESL